jgi:hypothetical protein
MTDTFVCAGWACTDCIILIANGETPPELTGDEADAWLAAVSDRNAGYHVAPGMFREDHACTDEAGRTAGDNGGDCDCETLAFTWSACDVCGSNLGGERHAVTFWAAPALVSAPALVTA